MSFTGASANWGSWATNCRRTWPREVVRRLNAPGASVRLPSQTVPQGYRVPWTRWPADSAVAAMLADEWSSVSNWIVMKQPTFSTTTSASSLPVARGMPYASLATVTQANVLPLNGDFDGDGVSNQNEFFRRTNPFSISSSPTRN